MYSNEFQSIVEFRRSNRKFDAAVAVPDEVIKRSLDRTVLSPNSSNMQLWEFHWVKSADMLQKLVPLCFSQQAALTAKHMVVFVTRRDLWRKRAKWHMETIRAQIKGEPDRVQKMGLKYYGKVMPIVYARDPFGILGVIRKMLFFITGLFRPIYRSGSNADQRVVVHKSCALAAQTFMLSIAAEGFHSCPMEGFDEVRVRKALGLPRGAEINMIISVGKGTEAGIWGPRYRVPNDEVIFVR